MNRSALQVLFASEVELQAASYYEGDEKSLFVKPTGMTTLIYLTLFDLTDAKGKVQRAQETLAEYIKVNRRTVMRHVKLLERAELLLVKRFPAMSKISNIYTVVAQSHTENVCLEEEDSSLSEFGEKYGPREESLGKQTECDSESHSMPEMTGIDPLFMADLVESYDYWDVRGAIKYVEAQVSSTNPPGLMISIVKGKIVVPELDEITCEIRRCEDRTYYTSGKYADFIEH